MLRDAPDSPPVTFVVRARSLPDTALRAAVMPITAFSGRGSGAVPQNSPACSAARYSVPVTRLQVPVSSPVTRVLRPTSVPVTRRPRLVLVVQTLAGAGPASPRPQGLPGGASPRPRCDCSMRRWRTAETGASATGVAGRASSTRAEKVSPCWQPQFGASAGAAAAVGAGARVRAAIRASVALLGAAVEPALSAPFPWRESAWRRAMAASRPRRRSAVAVAVASLIIWFPYASAVDH